MQIEQEAASLITELVKIALKMGGALFLVILQMLQTVF
jgi:hypothetical protein